MSWKIVPAVTEACYPQPAQTRKMPRLGHHLWTLHRGQQKPSGQRSLKRYSRHPSSLENRVSNSLRFSGSSSTPGCYPLWLGYRSQAHTQSGHFYFAATSPELSLSFSGLSAGCMPIHEAVPLPPDNWLDVPSLPVLRPVCVRSCRSIVSKTPGRPAWPAPLIFPDPRQEKYPSAWPSSAQ